MEETGIKKLVEVGLNRAFGNFKTVDAFFFEGSIVVDFDAIDPFQYEHAARRVIIIDARNVDGRVVLEHFFEAFSVGCLCNIIDLFVNGALKFAVDAHEVDELTGINQAIDDPDDEFDGTQIAVHELFDIGALHFDCDFCAIGGEYSLMHLAK